MAAWNEMYRTAAARSSKLSQGQVWCLSCGNTKLVNGAECLRVGWPMCCGHTMTIDSPAERG